jgi:hypothetical protein
MLRIKETPIVPVTSLWLPILLSAVAVFVVSSIFHMVLTYHRSDYRKLPSEDDVMETLRKSKVSSGDYLFPFATSPKAMKDPAFREKMTKGPVGFLTVREGGPPSMSKPLVLWFIYCVVVGIFAACVAGQALPAGAPGRSVLHFVGVTAFIGYALALWQNTIWSGRSAVITLKSTFDGLVYALLTAAIFGWLWPR